MTASDQEGLLADLSDVLLDEVGADPGGTPGRDSNHTSRRDTWSFDDHPESPEDRSGILGRVTFSWLTGLVRTGYKTPLQFQHLPQLAHKRLPATQISEFEQRWEKEEASGRQSLWAVVFGMYWRQLLATAGCALLQDVSIVVNFVVLQSLIAWVQAGDGALWQGLLYSGILFCSYLTSEAFARQQNYAQCTVVGIHVGNLMATLVYRKVLRLPASSCDKGQVVTLVSVDSKDAVRESFNDIHYLWNGPLQLLIILGLLFVTLGWATIAGAAILCVMVPLNLWLSKKWEAVLGQVMEDQQARVKSIAEVLDGIEVIKYFNWEQHVRKKIDDLRASELKGVLWFAILIAIIMTVILANYPVMAMASFALYYLLGNEMTPDVIFPCWYLFSLVVWPLLNTAHQLAKTSRARASMSRIRTFLLTPEVDLRPPSFLPEEDMDVMVDIGNPDKSSAYGVHIDNATFAHFGADQEPTLKDVTISAEPGQLVAIVGEVGSGKSSVLRSILGETVRLSGTSSVTGAIGYCAQVPWIRNMSLKDNVLCGKRFNEMHYADTLAACALLPDLSILPAGDNTEIGERGTNLSGGQKARVALARAVYSNSDVVLLDDPLSAVDAHVSNSLFHECICGVLKDTTRILVTHQLQFLPFVDKIYIMKDGRVEDSGSYEELTAKGVEFTSLAADAAPDDSAALRSSTDRRDAAVDAYKSGKEEDGRLIEEEERFTGNVTLTTWWRYLNSLGGVGFLLVFGVLSIGLVTADVSTSIALAVWTSNSSSFVIFLVIYASLALGYALLTLVRNFTWFLGSYAAAKKMHQDMLTAVMRSPLSFFTTTPKGRILNRFSKDQTVVDQNLPDALSDVIICGLDIIAKVIVMAVSAPILIVVFIPVAVVYYLLQLIYRPTKRELARLDSINSSPVYEHCSESVDGLETIRSFAIGEDQETENMHKLTRNMMADYSLSMVERWLGSRSALLGCTISLAVCIASVLMTWMGFRTALTYVAISYSLDVCGVLNWFVTIFAQSEAYMSHVERIQKYTDLTPEAPDVIEATEPSASWPKQGAIAFSGVTVRYSPSSQAVLDNLTFQVKGGERVGIVGRTGAGKSTLLMALFRLLEVSSGSISIDGLDISTLGLGRVRSGIAVIPQEPMLLSGTLRSNLDPAGICDDSAIWMALEHAHIADYVKEKMAEALDTVIDDGGQSLSVGQKQLICLARALLHKTSILVMDEATANVDPDTDLLIQETIRTEFAGQTVLTIAHRLSTIIDYDKVLVLDAGQLLEFDAPLALLEAGGAFHSLVEDTGARSAAKLLEQAQACSAASASCT